MGVELVRKYGNIAMRSCYISALRHPLLVVMVIHLIWMYRSFPFLFSLLVYASPVIVSTSLLLGTLLFFGHQNLPPKEGKPHYHHDIIHNRKTPHVVMGDTEIDESSGCEETHSSSKVLENAFKGKACVVNNNIKVNNVPNNIQIDKKGRSVYDSDSKTSRQSRKATKSQEVGKQQEKNKNIVVGGEKVVLFPDGAKNNKLKNTSEGNSGLLWKCGEKQQQQQKKDEDNKGWETGSELAESSSPSALMADDMFPEVPPQHTHLSNVTDVASDHSLESTDVVNETDDYDDEDDDDDEEEEEEEDQEVKDDEEEEEEASIMEEKETWTENDQKNLMNLGTSSDVERNQRMETLIARQRVLKNMRIMAEKNMVNSADIAATLISTTRNNHPLPYDSSNSHILPSSVRRNNNNNQFDYDPPIGEKQQPPQSHDSFQPNLTFNTHQSRDEQMAPDYSSMHTQTSEVSDSKVSSDTESTSADDLLENKRHTTKYDSFSSRQAGVKQSVNRLSEDDEDGRLDEVKTSHVIMDEADNQEKTSSNWSSSPLSDVTDHVYDEKEGEKNLETNYFGENNSHKIQMESPPTTRYVEYQQEAVPDNNKEQEKESSHEELLSLTDRSADKSTRRYAEDHNEVVPNNNNKQVQQQSTYSHEHKGTNCEENNNITSRPEEMSKPARRYDEEVENMVVPDNKQVQQSASSSHDDKGMFEEKSIEDRSPTRRNAAAAAEDQNDNKQSIHDDKEEELSLTDRPSPTRRNAQNEVVPAADDDDNKDQQSTTVKEASSSSSHHNATYEEKIIISQQPDELKRSKPEAARYDEEVENMVDNQVQQQSTIIIKASSQHNGTSEELYLTDTSRRNAAAAEDQHLIVPADNNNNKEQHNATQLEEMAQNPLTHEELQQIQQVNNNNSASTFEDKSCGMGASNTPASPPEYESNVKRIQDSNHEKNDDGDSSVYESGFDSDTGRSENTNTDFASASESETSTSSERSSNEESRFPQRLSRVQKDLTSWLTGWRV